MHGPVGRRRTPRGLVGSPVLFPGRESHTKPSLLHIEILCYGPVGRRRTPRGLVGSPVLFPGRESHTKPSLLPPAARKAKCINAFPALTKKNDRYYSSLASEAGTKNLPAVVTKIREESSVRFLHNLQHYRRDIYRIIDDNSYELISDGKRQVLC
ncbi:hypothetical protein RR46_00969 [Papilio xuthus]|uniref:Uncharacterized protein n=1 Tax=Papilio xuthus TaxID=66420 RepID=A0A0N0P9S0_PAPXU|nr:hypothetical protein RR46_00969 [Papilio xuthus]